MADNYAVLYSKYQRSMVAVSDLEQQRDRYQKELDRMTKESKQIEKNVRTLCETILKKDRRLEMVPGKCGSESLSLNWLLTHRTAWKDIFPVSKGCSAPCWNTMNSGQK